MHRSVVGQAAKTLRGERSLHWRKARIGGNRQQVDGERIRIWNRRLVRISEVPGQTVEIAEDVALAHAESPWLDVNDAS